MAIMVGRLLFFTPRRDIKAKIPPSPSLSTRITKVTYFIDTVISKAQIIRDKSPSIASADGAPPERLITVLNV